MSITPLRLAYLLVAVSITGESAELGGRVTEWHIVTPTTGTMMATKPISNVEVKVKDSKGFEHEPVVTNVDGTYVVRGLPLGQSTVRYVRERYSDRTLKVTIVGVRTTQDARLLPAVTQNPESAAFWSAGAEQLALSGKITDINSFTSAAPPEAKAVIGLEWALSDNVSSLKMRSLLGPAKDASGIWSARLPGDKLSVLDFTTTGQTLTGRIQQVGGRNVPVEGNFQNGIVRLVYADPQTGNVSYVGAISGDKLVLSPEDGKQYMIYQRQPLAPNVRSTSK